MIATASQQHIREADRIAFLRLRGTLDDKNVLSFKKSVFNIPPEKKVLVLDLSRLDQANNGGLAGLLDGLRYFRKRKGRVFLVNPGEEIELLLLHFRAGDLAEIVRSYDEVLNLLPAEGDSPFLLDEGHGASDPEVPRRGHPGVAPVVHYHYYGKNIERPAVREDSTPGPASQSEGGPLQELNRRLHRLQEMIEKKDSSQPAEMIQKRLEDLAGGELRMVDRLQTMERAIESRLDGMEARLLDRLDHSHSAATSLSTRPAATAFPGFRMIECSECGAVLRLHQSGRHMCPHCQTEFTVNEKGEAQF